jgi:hypothetical protein
MVAACSASPPLSPCPNFGSFPFGRFFENPAKTRSSTNTCMQQLLFSGFSPTVGKKESRKKPVGLNGMPLANIYAPFFHINSLVNPLVMAKIWKEKSFRILRAENANPKDHSNKETVRLRAYHVRHQVAESLQKAKKTTGFEASEPFEDFRGCLEPSHFPKRESNIMQKHKFVVQLWGTRALVSFLKCL